MDCSTIIVSYNTFDLTVEAIRSAAKSAEELDHEIIVVDNASPDRSGERLRELFETTPTPVRVIINNDNPGFSAANNQGAAEASGRVLFFLNPDTIVHGAAIPILCLFLDQHPDAGAVGPLVLNADGTIQPSTFDLLTARGILRQHLPLGSFILGRDRRIDRVPDQTSPVDIVKGCALALRRETYDKIGGWDESYFMYGEETEMCYRLLHEGFANYFVREASITHLGGAASMEHYAEQQIVHQRSATQFLRRHHSSWMVKLHRWSGLAGFAVRIPFFAILKRIAPDKSDEYQQRGDAARRLTQWFIREYE